MLQPGHTFGRYRVEEQLGAGGMGEVYRAWDSVLRRWVALKVVPKGDGSGRAARLLGEARAAAALRHPNIVSVYDVGEDDEYAFVSMDLVEGHPLRDYVGDASVAFEKQLAWLMQIASALRAAHKAGLVHRDMKPDNVMITTEGEVRVLDFGLAKSFGVDVTAATQHGDAGAPAAFKTAEGRVSGTPAYMAPEQLAGAPPSPSWDEYAWGVLACELLTGKHPRIAGLLSMSGWLGDDALERVPPSVAQTVARAMAPSPEQRFASMDAVIAALGGQVSSGAVVAPAATLPPNAPSTASTAMNVQLGETLQVPVHPEAPKVGRRSWALGWLVAGAAGLGAASVAAWHLRTPRLPPPAPTAIVASTAPARPTPEAPAPNATPSSTPSAAVATTPPPVAPPKKPSQPSPAAPPPKLAFDFRVNPSQQYDRLTILRAVRPVEPLAKACLRAHPPRRLPSAYGITLELWTFGDEVGKVSSVKVDEPPSLARCLRDAYLPLAFGPPKSPQMPPGAVFVAIEVTRE